MLLKMDFKNVMKSEEVIEWGNDDKPKIKINAIHIIWYKKTPKWSDDYIKQVKESKDVSLKLIIELRNKFMHELKINIKEIRKRGKIPRIVFPPWKPKGRPMEFVLELLDECDKEYSIFIRSSKYSLHDLSKVDERSQEIKKHSRNWRVDDKCQPFSTNDSYIFIDDIFTSGTTAKEVFNFLKKERTRFDLPALNLKENKFIADFEVVCLSRKYNLEMAQKNQGFVKIKHKELSKKINDAAKIL